MKFKKETYLLYNPFEGDDVDIKLQSTDIIKVRKAHNCSMSYGDNYHEIQPGEYAYREKAVVEGEWASSYCCINCMDNFLIENAGLEPDNIN